ncbi:hypothetical protein LCGC14_0094730 [marine sediment metagenome]|uniref:Glycosyltransferase subfamily 4-like N-terminal domain-containing protein n=1 Tax=marine sediment metagenome TaxID=412755 RepID=A0A0F9VUD6_9ZZZZ|nr:glycosyltransferase [Phycisphaerae bacterium]HDZ45246.1 glycosyltransferase [Phycisphaerae bacterium]
MTRIAHLCYAGTSGSARAAINIAVGSADPTRHVYVLYGACELRGDYGRQLDTLGCTWRYVRKPRGPLGRGYRNVARALIDLSADVVIVHGSRALPVAIWLDRLAPALPLVAVQHGPSREITSWWRRSICRRFSRLADATVTVSAGMADLIGRHRRLARAAQPLTVIPNGVDVNYWAADPLTRTADTPTCLTMVATLDGHKDHSTFLRAVRSLIDGGRDISACLVGAGPAERMLRKLTGELDLTGEVIFAGNLDRDDVRRVIHETDVLVHAARTESFGMAVLEAMAAARPVVATGCVGVDELIDDGRTGLLTPVGDAAALAAAIERLIDQPQLARQLAAAARREACERYSCRVTSAAYEALVDRLLAGEDRRSP